MKKKNVVMLVIGLLVLSFGLGSLLCGVAVNNFVISYEEQIFEAKSSVDIQVKKRNDTILTLVQVIEKYDEHEQTIIDAVTEARKQITAGNIGDATLKLNIILEAYPDIKSAENYRTLMLEISQCENQIARYREAFNIEVKEYKKATRVFPNSIFLKISGYQIKDVNYLEIVDDNNLKLDNIFGK